ncbi:hypothetical protein [Sinorhizobium fredii]|uniref:hypothetical protein n=1 Tax=Rhizobium fredii TaxID=380 RepID=UPI0013E8DD97|nr:hypothetical protein [Sinorhizobium fredii]
MILPASLSMQPPRRAGWAGLARKIYRIIAGSFSKNSLLVPWQQRLVSFKTGKLQSAACPVAISGSIALRSWQHEGSAIIRMTSPRG